MQFSENWLRSWINPDISSDELSERLTMAGLEVEDKHSFAPSFEGVVVAQIMSCEKHPNADKLNVCQVDIGDGVNVQIVCGAPNARAGIKIPCAKVGAVLPGDFKIKKAKLRDVESFGMLCSAKEIGLDLDSSGLLELPLDAEIGLDIRTYLALDDQILTIKLTPNRADCLSIHGVARDLAALTGAELTLPEFQKVEQSLADELSIRVIDTDGCPRFTGRLIKGIRNNVATPKWMLDRLERSGLRSISPLVDITNFVMMSLGQPMHVYDVSKLMGDLVVRKATQGESVILLNGQTIALDDDVLVIADQQKVACIAGIMGSDTTKADENTQDVFLEAAFFDPNVIQGKTRRFKFVTDSAHRFERGVDFDGQLRALELASSLVVAICGTENTKVSKVSDIVAQLPSRTPVKMRVSRANKVMGFEIPETQMMQYLSRLGLSPKSLTGNDTGDAAIQITPPSYRFDLAIEADVIEEILRVHGYNNIPMRHPRGVIACLNISELERDTDALKDQLCAQGYQECINFSFVSPELEQQFGRAPEQIIELMNPIASALSVMRTQLSASLLQNLKTNLARSQTRIRLFECAKVFHLDATVNEDLSHVKHISQPLHLGGIAYGAQEMESWASNKRDVDFYDVKGDLEQLIYPLRPQFMAFNHPCAHPGRCAQILVNGQVVGWMGELHPKLQHEFDLPKAPYLFELSVEAISKLSKPVSEQVSKQQQSQRDLALVIDQDITADCFLNSVHEGLRQYDSNSWVQDVQIFDVYAGSHLPEGQKSFAFRMSFQSMSESLSDAQIDSVLQGILIHLKDDLGALLRQ